MSKNTTPMPKKKMFKKGIIGRLIKMLFKEYPVLMPLVIVCILFSSAVSSIPALFMQRVIAVIEKYVESGNWEAARPEVLENVILLASMYILSVIALIVYTQLVAYITQGFLCKLRVRMFEGMEKLPISYFDRHKHGDIMSYYTNDIDTIRELISETIPSVLNSVVIISVVLGIMLYFSLWMTLLVLVGVAAIFLVSKKLGGGSTKYFIKTQKTTGRLEGFAQEMMSGLKVVKVFNHEKNAQKDFDAINNELCEDSYKAMAAGNTLGPVVMNIGNVLYVLMALLGGLLLILKVPNMGFMGMALVDVSIIVPFLNMTKQFTGNLNNVSQQLPSVAQAIAGIERVFTLIDEQPEADNGYVTLVNAVKDENGNISESEKRTGLWAWKHPHGTGEVTYSELKGDVRLVDVDFSYEPGKPVLKNVSVYAEPGQKVAFVGATGAGKTTITNLINRFYDIEDGKIRYDGININKIKKGDLRRSLGIVLQDTNLITGTVMDNIRYGKLDATDEDCIEAAKLVGADDFIVRLPDGYNTLLTANGSNLSQGQRQLISIARAAVADPPVMILDEATSSIDTRTESVVQNGMDKLMEGRTVFVIAHRLSTVMNSDVIMVLDHGEIIERGTHDSLIEKKGVYYRLYTGDFELE